MNWDRTLANIIHEMSPKQVELYEGIARHEGFTAEAAHEAFGHLAMSENIQSCEASIAASAAVLESMADCLTQGTGMYKATFAPAEHPDIEFHWGPVEGLYESTSGREIQQEHPTSPETPKGLLRVATDGERCNGRLAWVPGAR